MINTVKITFISSILLFSFLIGSCTSLDPAKNGSVTAPGKNDSASAPGMEIRVLAYNVYMRPIIPLKVKFDDGQSQRAEYIPKKVKNYDVIVFSEVFDGGVRETLRSKLKNTYPYITSVVGKQDFADVSGGVTNGGVMIFSKWPILDGSEDERTFDKNCSGSDCLANKGVKYVKIKKNNKIFHIFGTHAQAGNSIYDMQNRTKQFVIIKKFIDSKNINKEEPVIIAGDLNVPFSKKAEFNSMLNRLNASMPKQAGNIFLSKDGRNNDLAEDSDENVLIDYVLYSKNHYKPLDSSFNEVQRFTVSKGWKKKEKGKVYYDLSDHYAVLGFLKYECQVGYHREIKEITTDYTIPFDLKACKQSCKNKFDIDRGGDKRIACINECIKNSNSPNTGTSTKKVVICVKDTEPDVTGLKPEPVKDFSPKPAPVKDPSMCPPVGVKKCPGDKICVVNKCQPSNTMSR